jgi:hypothetical protein
MVWLLAAQALVPEREQELEPESALVPEREQELAQGLVPERVPALEQERVPELAQGLDCYMLRAILIIPA